MLMLRKMLGLLLGSCVAFGISVEVLASGDVDIDYTTSSENSAAADGITGYETVLITKHSDNSITDDSIVYIKQTDGGLGSAASFLLKSGAEYGLYDVVFGNSGGESVTKNFWLGVDAPTNNDVRMRRLITTLTDDTTGKTYYTAGFYAQVDGSDYENYNSLKVGYNNGTDTYYGALALRDLGFPNTYSGTLMLMFELTEIEADELDSVTVFLSPATVGGASAYR